MFDISADTFSKLSDIQLTGFIERLAEYLLDAVPTLRDVPRGEFLLQLRYLAEQAQNFGMRSEQAIAIYAVTAGQLGFDFVEKFPGARQIVEANLPEGEKSDLLQAFTLNLLEILEN